jgi:hypothetical protein
MSSIIVQLQSAAIALSDIHTPMYSPPRRTTALIIDGRATQENCGERPCSS